MKNALCHLSQSYPLCLRREEEEEEEEGEGAGVGAGAGGARPPNQRARGEGFELAASSAILQAPLRTFGGALLALPAGTNAKRAALTML